MERRKSSRRQTKTGKDRGLTELNDLTEMEAEERTGTMMDRQDTDWRIETGSANGRGTGTGIETETETEKGRRIGWLKELLWKCLNIPISETAKGDENVMMTEKGRGKGVRKERGWLFQKISIFTNLFNPTLPEPRLPPTSVRLQKK